jgi:hypothetical protein
MTCGGFPAKHERGSPQREPDAQRGRAGTVVAEVGEGWRVGGGTAGGWLRVGAWLGRGPGVP